MYASIAEISAGTSFLFTNNCITAQAAPKKNSRKRGHTPQAGVRSAQNTFGKSAYFLSVLIFLHFFAFFSKKA